MLWNAVTLALGAIGRNVLRSCLTMLGIVIGVASVITLVTIVNGVRTDVTDSISSMGSNLLFVTPGGSSGFSGRGAQMLEEADADAILAQVPSVRAVAPSAQRGALAVYGNENWRTTITGATESYFDVSPWDIVQGRGFTFTEIQSGASVCIIGSKVRTELFGASSPLGESIRLNRLSCEVVGLLEEKGSTMAGDQDSVVFVPLRTFQRRIMGRNDVQVILVSVRNASEISRAKREIERLMRERRRIGIGEDDNFTVGDMREAMDIINQTIGTFTIAVAAIAGISLVVGGIGIMNIMLVSVTERTREIGTRLAIGALERDVMLQFLVEAAVLSSLGGIIGIALALGLSYLIMNAVDLPFGLDFGIIGMAVAFSAFVGLVFGLLPAYRAARLNPIDALRHE
ncbi:MAG: ABC transporter permease [Maricaulaceae bacterium]|jgi:putative ABC transport system permease protein